MFLGGTKNLFEFGFRVVEIWRRSKDPPVDAATGEDKNSIRALGITLFRLESKRETSFGSVFNCKKYTSEAVAAVQSWKNYFYTRCGGLRREIIKLLNQRIQLSFPTRKLGFVIEDDCNIREITVLGQDFIIKSWTGLRIVWFLSSSLKVLPSQKPLYTHENDTKNAPSTSEFGKIHI